MCERYAALLRAVSFPRDSFVVSRSPNDVLVLVSVFPAPRLDVEYSLLSPLGECSFGTNRDKASVPLAVLLRFGDLERSFSGTRDSPKEPLCSERLRWTSFHLGD